MQQEGAPRPLLQVFSDKVNRASEVLLFLLMLLMIGVTTAQVFFRFFFEALTWSEELSCFLLVLASLLAAAVAFKRGTHIAVTFLTQKLPGISGHGFHIATLSFGVQCIERQTGFAGATGAAADRHLFAGQFDGDVLEIVLLGALDAGHTFFDTAAVYGLGRFPVTLYKEQWGRLLDMADDIRGFIKENEATLKRKEAPAADAPREP